MVAEPSVHKLTTALDAITSANENVSQGLTQQQRDLEQERALDGVNANTQILEWIIVQIAESFN